MKARRWLLAVVASALLAPAPAASQSVVETVYTDLKHGVGDMLAVWSAPFRGSADDYKTFGLLVGAAGASALLDETIGDWVWDNQSAFVMEVLDPFGERDSKPKLVDLGAGTSLVQIGGGLYLIGLVFGSEDLRDAGIGCVASEKANGIPRHYIYKGVSRERPLYQEVIGADTIFRKGNPYDIEFPSQDDWYDNSFFGGHGANIMACATFVNHRFDLGYAEPVIWTVATGVNIARIADQRHWTSDVVVGAVFGYAIGKYVAERSLDRKAERTRGANGQGEGHDTDLKDQVLGGLWMSQQDGRTFFGWKHTF